MADEPDEELRRLRERLASLERRVSDLEAERDRRLEAAPDEDAGTARDAAPEPSAPSPTVPADSDGPGPDDRTADASPDREAAAGDADARDWEQDVGIRWLGVAGGVALVLGVVFFVQVAIDRGLLGPLGRVAVGAIGGLALLGTGRFLAQRRGYVRWGRIAAGTGLAIAYFSVYVAYEFESYRESIGTPLWAVLLALTAVVAGAVALSLRDETPVIAAEAFLLGYVTAYLAVDAGSGALTPAYVLLLVAGLIAIAAVRPWSLPLLASAFASYAVLGLWLVVAEPVPALQLASFAATFLAYVVGGYVLAAGASEDRSSALEVGLLTAANASLGALTVEAALRRLFDGAPVEGVAVAAVAAVLLGAYFLTDRRAVQRDDAAGWLAVVLAGIAGVLAAGPFWSTVALVAVVVAAVALSSVAAAPPLRTGAHALVALTAYKLFVADAWRLDGFDAGEPLAAATGRPAAFLLGIALSYGLAWWWRRADATELSGFERNVELPLPYAWLGSGLVVALLALELQGLGISVSWAVFGLALVGLGMARELRTVRLQGIAVLGLATVKVFLIDTSDLGLLARAASALVLGAILLVASLAYARWQGSDPLEGLSGE